MSSACLRKFATATETSQKIGTWQRFPSINSTVNQRQLLIQKIEALPLVDSDSKNAALQNGDNNGSVNSGSVISSSSNQGQGLETNQGSSAMQGQSASNSWSANPNLNGLERHPWNTGNVPSSAASINMGWGSLPQSLSMNNQGHNMQLRTSTAGSDNSYNSMVSNLAPWGAAAQSSISSRPQNGLQGSQEGGNVNRSVPNNGAQICISEPQVNQSRQIGNSLSWQGVSAGGAPNLTNNTSPWSASSPGSQNGAPGNVMGDVSNQEKTNVIQQSGVDAASNLGVSSANNNVTNNTNNKKTGGGWERATSPATSSTDWVTGGNKGNPRVSSASSQGQLGNNSNPPKTQPSTWAQAAGKGLNTSSNSNNASSAAGNNGSQSSSREEEIRRAIECHDGWGQRPIRQDTAWEVECSPKSKRKYEEKVATNVWNNGNNGTAIWEASKDGPTPWWNSTAGASGASNWNDADNSNNTWAGSSREKPNSGATNENSGNSWCGAGGGNNNNNSNGNGGTNGVNWGGGDKGMGMWGGQPKNWGGKTETGAWNASNFSHSNAKGPKAGWGESSNECSGWEEPSPPTQRRHIDIDNGTSFWGDPVRQARPQNWNNTANPSNANSQRQKSDDSIWNKRPNKQQSSGWGDPSPPNTKVDDGTSIWAANAQQQAKTNGWGETSQWGSCVGANPKTASSWNDNDISTWNPLRKDDSMQQGWTEECGDNASWHDADMGNWNDGSQENHSSWSSAPGWKGGKRNNFKGANKFPGGNNQPPQMRVKLLQQLMDMGFKKDEAQTALISNNMNLESALADLRQGANAAKKECDDVFHGDVMKRKLSGIIESTTASGVVDDISDTQSESGHFVPNISMQNTPFPNAQSQIPNQQIFTSPLKPGTSIPQSSLASSTPSISSSSNSILHQKIIHHKINQQQQQQQPQTSLSTTQGPAGRSTNSSGGGGGGGGQIPSQNAIQQQMAQHQILQQLRMAVQAGLISPQLLNQQLPPAMLLMLQQLLQLQSFLQQLVTRQQLIQQNKGTMAQRQQMEQTVVMINKVKHQMMQLQQQIAQAQQLLPKPQTVPEPIDAFSPLQNDMANLSISGAQPQSRLLNQWKRPSPEKESDNADNMVNRAVGSKPLHQSQSTPNLGRYELSLGLSDSTWSNVPTTSSQNWPNVGAIGTNSQSESKEISENKESQSSTTAFSLNDMIPEFVPGKPWLGITKSVEDDPYITPGSFSRSLSVNTIKDDYLTNFSTNLAKSSPSVTESSGSWPVKDFPKTAQNKSWNSVEPVTPTSFTSEVWGVPLQPKISSARPPGLAHKSSNWSSALPRQTSWSGRPSDSSLASVNSSNWVNVTNWLVLRNLTPQIDGSTLKTLCQQHGPLQCFYLSLNHGQALVRYSQREEAIKAQKSLNTCVLGNTTILAEFVTEAEATRLIEQSSMSAAAATTSQWSQSSQSNYRTGHYNNRNEAAHWNMTPVSYCGFPGNGMWNSGLLGGVPMEEHGATPLLGNILGGESM